MRILYANLAVLSNRTARLHYSPVERHRKGECRVLPVLISPCDFEGLPFADIQMLPQRADTNRLHPVSLWTDQDEALVAVVQGIKKAMAELAV